jgi:hypothetical protein
MERNSLDSPPRGSRSAAPRVLLFPAGRLHRLPLLLAVAANLIVGFFVATLPQDKGQGKFELEKFSATLIAAAIFLPSISTVMTVVIYLGNFTVSVPSTLLWGLTISIWAWLVAALVGRRRAMAENAIPGSYDELRLRMIRLKAELVLVSTSKNQKLDLDSPEGFPEELRKNVAFNEANNQRLRIEKELNRPGLHWLSAMGYVKVWDRLYRAEKALIEILSNESAIGEAYYDELRLQNSKIQNSIGLNNKLNDAVKTLGSDKNGSLG